MTFWNKVSNQNKIDSSLISELNDISYRSIGGKRQPPRGSKEGIVNLGNIPFEVNPPPTEITREMIQEYQKSQQDPYIDPLTGNKFKYYPSSFKYDTGKIKAYVPIDDATLGAPATEKDIQDYKDEIHKLSTIDLPRETKKLKLIKKDLVDVDKSINEGISVKVKGVYVMKPLTPAKLATAIALKTNIEAKIITQEKTVSDIIDDIKINETKMEDAIKNIQDNKDEQIAVIKENKDNLRLYEETLLSVNRNKLNLQKEPNEGDADYIQRMNNIEAEAYDTNLYEERAKLDEINKLKVNLKGIIRKDDMIENIIKSFTGEQIFVVNKNFTVIKNAFLETFGFNNSNLTTIDIVDEITNILQRVLNPPTAYEIENDTLTTPATGEPVPVHTLQDTTGKNTDYEFGTNTNSLYIKNTKNNNHLYLKIGQKNKNVVFFSKTQNSQGSFIAVRERGDPREETLRYLIFDYLLLDKYADTQIFQGSHKINDIYKTLEDMYKLQPLTDIKTHRLTATTIKYGWGLSHPDEELPVYAKFGNLIIFLQKLFYKNILCLKTKAGHTIDGLKNTKVSDNFVEIIIKLYKEETVDSLVKHLTSTETNLLNSILYMAGLHKKFKTNTDETLTSVKERFKIVEGEILAGNNNPEVMKELKEILLKLHHFNAISIHAIRKYLSQFN